MSDDLVAFLRARLDEDERAAREEIAAPGMNEYDPETYNSPARVLREVEAKRAILAVHSRAEGWSRCATCLSDRTGYGEMWDPDEWPCNTLRLLALPYADHSDYRAEWGA